MVETDKPQGVSVVPPTVPIPGVNIPDPTTGSETEGRDPNGGADSAPHDPDAAQGERD